MTHPSRPVLTGIAGCLIAVLLSGCAADGEYIGSGNWKTKPEQQAPQGQNPQKPSKPTDESTPSDPQEKDDGVRATGLDQPSAIAALPDGTALVGERTNGKVTKVFPAKGTPQQPLYTVPGLDASNGGGLVAMVASPYYAENGLIFAYITTATEGQVITLNAAGVPKVVVTGLPKAPAALAVGPDKSILIATGGTGPLGGKILSTDPWGGPGPSATEGLVVGPGVPNPAGLCTAQKGGKVYAVETGSGAPGALSGNGVYQVSGEKPSSGGMGTAAKALIAYTAGKDAGAMGCVASDVAIVTAGTDSQSLATSVLDKDGVPTAEPALSLTGTYGRLRAIAMNPQQPLMWVATSNRDGIGAPGAEDDRVILIPPPSGASQSPEDKA